MRIQPLTFSVIGHFAIISAIVFTFSEPHRSHIPTITFLGQVLQTQDLTEADILVTSKKNNLLPLNITLSNQNDNSPLAPQNTNKPIYNLHKYKKKPALILENQTTKTEEAVSKKPVQEKNLGIDLFLPPRKPLKLE